MGGNIAVEFIHQFDSKTVLTAAEKARKKILYQFGAYVRKTARKSIRPASAKREVSQEGEPPVGHGIQSYRALMEFAVDIAHGEVVIGSVLFNNGALGKAKVPKIIEYGGEEDVVDGKGNTVRVTYKERPAVRLAYKKTVKKFLPELLENSIVP